MKPRPAHPGIVRYRSLLATVVAGLAFLLYALTAAPGLTWGHDGADGGDLIAASMTFGVPHPSGYPTWCLLGRLFAFLPLGSIARRFNLFSSAAAAGAVGLMYLVVRQLFERDSAIDKWFSLLLPAIAALAFATGRILWSQAIITEVYALHTFFAVACFYLALREDLLARTVCWGLEGLLMGVGLGVHLTLLLMLPGLLVLVWPKIRAKNALAFALGVLAGLSVYSYLPLAAQRSPPVNWGNPQTWEGFRWLVSGRAYRHYLFGLPLCHLPSRIGAFIRLWGQNLTLPGVAISLVGLWYWVEKKCLRLAAGTGLIFGAYTIYAVTYDTTDSYVYLLPALAVSAAWMGQGLAVLLDTLTESDRRLKYVRGILLLLLLLPIWSVAHNVREIDLSGDRTAEQWIDQTLATLPEDALLITGQDRHTFGLDYARWVEGRRLDLVIIDGELLPYEWYRRQIGLHHSLKALESATELAQLVEANLGQRPIYLASPRDSLSDRYEIVPQGHLWRLSGERETDRDREQ